MEFDAEAFRELRRKMGEYSADPSSLSLVCSISNLTDHDRERAAAVLSGEKFALCDCAPCLKQWPFEVMRRAQNSGGPKQRRVGA